MENSFLEKVQRFLGLADTDLETPVIRFTRRILPALGGVPDAKATRTSGIELFGSVIIDESSLEGKQINERAIQRVIYEESKYQKNIESIVFDALPLIGEQARPEGVNEDWLNNFFSKSRLVSNADMQKLWSQILAGEVNQPGSFSKRTINFLETMSQEEAEIFRLFTSCIWQLPNGKPLAIVYAKDVMGQKSNTEMSYKKLIDLQDLGLIYFAGSTNVLTTRVINVPLRYNGRQVVVKNPPGKEKDMLSVGHAKLTQTGVELYKICQPVIDFGFYELAIAAWKKRGYIVDISDVN